MTTIPNELKIIINTSIPGFKKITYTPSMTIPNISKDENSIQFNPLVKLNQSTVDKVPENLRKKEFFNKGLFQSLINYIQAAPVSLLYATNNGYVDNNIKVTLNTIFHEKSIIYINKKPYTIVDVQWSKGDWKLDTKHKPQELDISKITYQNLNANLLKEQINSGKKQLENLPPSIVYGPSFNGPKNAFGSVIRQPPTSLPLPTASTSSNTTTVLPRPDIKPSKLLPSPTERLAIEAPPSSDTSTPILSSSNTTRHDIKLLPAPPERLAIEAPPSIDTSIPTVASVNVSDVVVPASLPINLFFSSVSTSHLRNYLNNQQFYFCINAIFQKLSARQKEIINNNLLHTSKININENGINLSKLAYSNSVKSIAVNETPPNGNCFFSSTADALNYHNYTNETDKIIHGIYGIGDKNFTQSYLRSLVVKYYFSPLNADLIESFHQFALVNVNELNETFENQVKTIKAESGPESGREFVLSTEQYIEIANDVRKNSDNFLVNVVREVPIEDANYFKPFSEINNADEIKDYLMSKTYWANEIAIYALCSEIGINVIPIHKVEKHADKYMLKIPFGNFSKNRNNNWSRYLFLYWSEGHYELLSFNFIEKKLVKKIDTPNVISYSTKKTIFKRNDLTTITPLCILFLIFGEYYYSQKDEVKSNFSFFPQIMQLFEDKFNEALRDASIKDELSAAFKTFFENAEKMTLTGLPSSGGANPYYNQPYNHPYNHPYNQPYNQHYSPRYNQRYNPPYSRYYNQYYNSQQPRVQNLVKKENKVDNINISYYISIDIELYPGKSIPTEELHNLHCTQKWNAVRKAYSVFTGKPYVISPVYRIDKVDSKELQKKQNSNSNNKTRKYYQKPYQKQYQNPYQNQYQNPYQNPYQRNRYNVTKKYYNR